MAVTAKMVKELRDMTGSGMMDCKKALVEADGDMDKAVEILKEKGLSKAAKKAGRIAAMGLVKTAFSEDGKSAAIVEVNSETDFVAKNDEFIGFVDGLAKLALDAENNDIEAFKAMPYEGATVGDALTALIAKIGDTVYLFLLYQFTYLFTKVCLIYHERKLSNYYPGLTIFHGLYISDRADSYLCLTCPVCFLDSLISKYYTAGRKIRSLNYGHDLFYIGFTVFIYAVIYHLNYRTDNLP